MKRKILWAGVIAAILIALMWQSQAQAKPCACRLSPSGLDLIKKFEGFYPYPYLDVGGKPTIGFGHLILPGENYSGPLLGHEAEDLLRGDAAIAERSVKKYIAQPMEQGQYDALVSFTYNLGPKPLYQSLLGEYARLGVHERVPGQIRRWVYVGKKKVRGLVNRREAEAKMYEEATAKD